MKWAVAAWFFILGPLVILHAHAEVFKFMKAEMHTDMRQTEDSRQGESLRAFQQLLDQMWKPRQKPNGHAVDQGVGVNVVDACNIIT